MRSSIFHLLCCTALAALSVTAQRTATGTAVVVNGFVVGVNVTDGGEGYTLPPLVSFSGGGGTGATAVAVVSNGAVTSVTVLEAGRGYTSLPEVLFSAPTVGPFTDGLLAYFPFDGDSRDLSGNANDGVITDAAFTTDRYGDPGKALFFNGLTSQVEVPAFRAIAYYPMTYSVWFIAEEPSAPTRQMLRALIGRTKPGAPQCGAVCLMTEARQGFAQFANQFVYYTGLHVTEPAFEPAFGRWQHLAMTIDAERKVVWYENGRRVHSEDFPYPQSDALTFLIGALTDEAGWNPPPERWRGKIDQVRVYSRALSDSEVRDLFHYESPGVPAVRVIVKTVRLDFILKVGRKYQVEASSDLNAWSALGDPFVAVSSESTREVDAAESGRYFRVYEVQP